MDLGLSKHNGLFIKKKKKKKNKSGPTASLARLQAAMADLLNHR